MAYLGKVVAAGITLLLLLVVAFVAMRVIPGDPALMLAGDVTTPEQVERIRAQLGLDKPIPVQMWNYIGDIAGGNLGHSLRTGRDVKDEISSRIGRTLILALASVVLAAIFGVTLGMVAAWRAGTWADSAISALSILAVSTPIYWSGLLFIYLFALTLHLLPTGGYSSPFSIVLPMVTLGFYQSGSLILMTRAHMLDAIHSDHVRTARAKGLSEVQVMVRHVLRLSLIPIVAMMAMQFGRAFGGAAVTETVFSWAGIGQLLVEATATRDFPLVQALLLFFGVIFLSVNMLAELLYTWIDPRVRTTQT